MKLTTLAARFLRMGATGFGGAMVLIGLMQRDLVERGKEVSPELFAEGVAVGQILPGPVAVNCAGYLGFRLRGFVGALVTVVSLILPPFLLMLVLTPMYLHYGKVPQVAGFFKGVTPAVVAVILATAWRMGRKFVVGWAPTVIAVLVAAGAVMKASPLLLVLAAGALGMLFRWPRAEPAPASAEGAGGTATYPPAPLPEGRGDGNANGDGSPVGSGARGGGEG